MNLDYNTNILDIKKVGVILRPNTPEIKDFYLYVKKLFEDKSIEVELESKSAKMIAEKGVDLLKLCENSDILVSIGGDGTLISVIRRTFLHNKPVLGINMGNLGFLTDIQKDEVSIFLEKLVNGNYRIDRRMLLEVTLNYSNGEKKRSFALNDAVITRNNISKMVHIKALIDKEPFNTYYGDGLIISTPTGSTAYNISSGGPVVYPFSKILIITPICPHSLTQRPLVLPAEFQINLEVADGEDAVIVLDGQDVLEFNPGDIASFRLADINALLIHRKERNYFKILREKFNWGSM